MDSASSPNWKKGLLLSLCAAGLWGVLPIIMKGAIRDFDPFTATWFRFAGGASLFGAWLFLRRPGALKPNWKTKRAWLLPVAILGMSGNFCLLAWSLEYQSPSVSQIVLQIGPPLVFLGGAFIFGDAIARLQWLGFLLLLPGLALFFNARLPLLFSGTDASAIGVLLIAISAVCFATYSLSQKALMPAIRPETTLFWGLIGGLFILFPFARPGQLLQAGPIGVSLIGGAILNTFIPFLCYGEALRVWETSRVGAIVALPPLVTLFATGLVARLIPEYIQAEHLNAYSVIGVLVFVTGCLLAGLGRGAAVKTSALGVKHGT